MLTADGKLQKYHGYGRVKLDVGCAQPSMNLILVAIWPSKEGLDCLMETGQGLNTRKNEKENKYTEPDTVWDKYKKEKKKWWLL